MKLTKTAIKEIGVILTSIGLGGIKNFTVTDAAINAEDKTITVLDSLTLKFTGKAQEVVDSEVQIDLVTGVITVDGADDDLSGQTPSQDTLFPMNSKHDY